MDLSMNELVSRIVKYLVEGLVVAIAAIFIPKKSLPLDEVMTLAILAAAVFALLDLFVPSIGASARNGVGLSLGAGIAGGFPVRM
jgi:hypothetical protein